MVKVIMDVSALKDQKKGIILQSQVCLTPSLHPSSPLHPLIHSLPAPPYTTPHLPYSPPAPFMHPWCCGCTPLYPMHLPCDSLHLPRAPLYPPAPCRLLCTLPAPMLLLQGSLAVLSPHGLSKGLF